MRLPDPRAVQFARQLRADATDAERLLWSRLRRRALGVRFRRQAAVGRYVVDFCCLERRLVIEVDGAHPFEPDVAASDAERTRFLEHQGLRVARYTDHEVLTQLDAVVQAIADELTAHAPSPTLPR